MLLLGPLLGLLPASTRAGSWACPWPGVGVGGDERSVSLSPAALGEESLGADGGWGLACSVVRTQGTFRGG